MLVLAMEFSKSAWTLLENETGNSLTQSAKLNVVTRDSNISFYDHLAYLIKPNNR